MFVSDLLQVIQHRATGVRMLCLHCPSCLSCKNCCRWVHPSTLLEMLCQQRRVEGAGGRHPRHWRVRWGNAPTGRWLWRLEGPTVLRALRSGRGASAAPSGQTGYEQKEEKKKTNGKIINCEDNLDTDTGYHHLEMSTVGDILP